MAGQNIDTSTVKPVADLLIAHAELIKETSESMAEDLASSLQKLRDQLPTDCLDEATQQTVADLLSTLQFQDFVRQQVDVLVQGLETVADAKVPADNDDPQDWCSLRLQEIEEGYVMHAQFLVHEQILGHSSEASACGDNVFFD